MNVTFKHQKRVSNIILYQVRPKAQKYSFGWPKVHNSLKKTYPGVDTVGEGLLDLISILLAFLIGNVVGVVNISSAVGSLFCEI